MRQQFKNKSQTCPLRLKPKSTLAAPVATVIASPCGFAVRRMGMAWGKRRGSSPQSNLLPWDMACEVHTDTFFLLSLLLENCVCDFTSFCGSPKACNSVSARAQKYFSLWNTASPVLVAVQGREEEEVCAAVALGNNLGDGEVLQDPCRRVSWVGRARQFGSGENSPALVSCSAQLPP